MQRFQFFAALAAAVPLLAADGGRAGVTVHEWGTFTSVAGLDGGAVNWEPLDGPSDLPRFVHRGPIGKQSIHGSVRMETPVLYFYTAHPMTLSVRVDFPHGWITEWYPQATSANPVAIRWDSLEVSPGDPAPLPVESGASHYYAARLTDSAPVRSGGEREKLVFYRGIGSFAVPVRVQAAGDGKVVNVVNAGNGPIPVAILFENRGGKTGYRVVRGLKGPVQLDAPELAANLDALRAKMESELVQAGLFPKEARAMLETWRDSWFEEGTRVFYVLPRTMTDAVLPLDIQPQPAEIARVFVGRIEVLTPYTEKSIRTALSEGDASVLAKYGRFLKPFLAEMAKAGR